MILGDAYYIYTLHVAVFSFFSCITNNIIKVGIKMTIKIEKTEGLVKICILIILFLLGFCQISPPWHKKYEHTCATTY